jgi:hypothetical protein
VTYQPANQRPEPLLEELASLSELAAGIFADQWHECRGAWDREDWFDRIQATIRYWEEQGGDVPATLSRSGEP